MKNTNMFKTVVVAGLFLVASSAQAVIVEETVLSGGGSASYVEGEFAIINNTSTDIYAFVVAMNDSIIANTTTLGWDAQVVYAEDWDFYTTMDLNLEVATPTASLGTFDSLFPGFNSAFLYSYNALLPSTGVIAAGTSAGGFYFGAGALYSPFIAIDGFGQVIDAHNTVHVSAVPLPAAIWLFGFGLSALGLVARRRRA